RRPASCAKCPTRTCSSAGAEPGSGRERARRVADHGGTGGDVPGHHRTGADRGPGPDPDAAEDRRPGADRGAALDHRRQQLPVGLALQLAVAVGRPRPLIVDERDPVADEDLVLDRDPVADEGVALDLAGAADAGAALDLDEGADAGAGADLAAVEVGEGVDGDVLAEGDVVEQAMRGLVTWSGRLRLAHPSINGACARDLRKRGIAQTF